MRRDFAAFAAALALLSPTAVPVHAKTVPLTPAQTAGTANPVVRVLPANAQTLADALRQVSQQTGAAFVCEGKPFRARNSSPPLVPVLAKWPANGLPLDAAVSKIADAYDYEAERNGSVFLLRKRYTNPEDLPDVPAEELRLSVRDVVRAASGLPAPTVEMPTYEVKNSPFADKFYQTLTPAQMKQLVGKKDEYVRLPVAELTPAQKKMMHDVVVSRHIQNAVDEPRKALTALQACSQKSTAFGWTNIELTPPSALAQTYYKHVFVPMLCCLVRENGKTAAAPFAPDGRVRFRLTNRKIAYDANGDGSEPRPDDFGPNHTALPPPTETGPDTFTLQSLAVVLTKSETRTGKISPHGFKAHEALEAKSVTVVGINDDNTESLWRGAGAVYGLHAVHTQKNGPLLLLRPRPQVARDLSELNAAVFSAFPAPVIRLYRGAFQGEQAKQLARPKSDFYLPAAGDTAEDTEFKTSQWAENARSEARDNAPRLLRYAVFHRFRVLLEPSLPIGSSDRVLYHDMSDEAHDLWTLILCLDCLQNVSGLENAALPLTITDFDKGFLTSSVIDGFGSSEPELYITFWAYGDKTVNREDVGHVFPLPASVPYEPKPAP